MSHAPWTRRALAAAAAAGLAASLTACSSDGAADDGEVLVGLITKTETNPFFVKMKGGAEEAAEEHGVRVQSFSGEYDGDNEGQVQAVENLIAAGADGILITPNDSEAIVPALDRARAAGIMVIALDTPTEPADAVDATFATDNFLAGEYIGRWAAARFEAEGEEPRVAMLDLNPNQIAVDVDRDQGFLQGLGVDIADPGQIGDEDDERIVGHDVTEGAEEGGRTAMENLLQRDPDLNLVYTINEPAAAGAYEALEAAGVEDDVTIVSVDGGCPGVENVESGVLGATSMQFPMEMAAQGVEAVAEHADSGATPTPSEGLDFVDTGVELITDEAVEGVESRDSAWGLENCWG
ncbi:sugar ABC transporter substrate-binding protein [Nocardiopsis sp. RSe5-2]|uniref:Sugar ABC transporter substrate-binding protein n=1 Tax=Nocardiopsis endophytica TaxID=3018445 RepID=A0ABT4U0D9_9ACTN|nr:sugar ABC transporter substrate-binding protein [Nocardiopsis endophytica]MDA2810141.1 sugar ABC transporter substrate-binding protein [Nocardiopsis endophytica]